MRADRLGMMSGAVGFFLCEKDRERIVQEARLKARVRMS